MLRLEGVETFLTKEDSGGVAERVPLVAVSPPFEDVYRARYRSLLKLAFVLCGSHHAAEELVQETFLAAFRKWDSVSRFEYPEAWSRRVVVNKANSRLRRSYAETRAGRRWSAGRPTQVTIPESSGRLAVLWWTGSGRRSQAVVDLSEGAVQRRVSGRVSTVGPQEASALGWAVRVDLVAVAVDDDVVVVPAEGGEVVGVVGSAL